MSQVARETSAMGEAMGPFITRCIKFKTLCHFTPISVKRKPRRPPGQKRVEELENRLKKMEEKLKRAANTNSTVQEPVDNGNIKILPQTALMSTRNREDLVVSRDQLSNPRTFSPDPTSDILTDVQTTGIGIGSPSILLNVYHPKDWTSIHDFRLTPVSDIFSRRVIKPLPPKSEALLLIQKSFEGFSSAFPIFNQANFLARFNTSESPYEDPGWWACLNVILALAHRFRAMVGTNSRQEDKQAWGYFQNALAVTTELTMLNDTVAAVQALVGMAIVVQGTPNPAPYASLTAKAMRLAQTLGLHRSMDQGMEQLGVQREVREERKRVFWIAYILDKDVSLRMRRPPIQDDEEMDVELPLDDPSIVGLGFLNIRIRLAMIQGQIYKRLLSISANRQSYPQRVIAIRELEAKLQAWRVSVPIDFQDEYIYMAHNTSSSEPIVHSVILRLVYFNSLSAIHSSTPFIPSHKLLDSELGVEQQHRELPPPITLVTEARKAIRLLHVTPQGDYACVWVVLHIFVSATKTLLIHLIQSPNDPLAMSDLQLIDPMLRLLGLLAKGERSREVMEMYTQCTDLFERARMAIDDPVNSVVPWTGGVANSGQSTERESLDDFIRRIEIISAGYDDVPTVSDLGCFLHWIQVSDFEPK
ncbi:hypothetical protein EG329_014045 [Mollisiaceae sp. DMI_Dod_QoI]|nr:hypothetical protein EG329_014045 [Helotiales sp. DMI_Dod_QoI]